MISNFVVWPYLQPSFIIHTNNRNNTNQLSLKQAFLSHLNKNKHPVSLNGQYFRVDRSTSHRNTRTMLISTDNDLLLNINGRSRIIISIRMVTQFWYHKILRNHLFILSFILNLWSVLSVLLLVSPTCSSKQYRKEWWAGFIRWAPSYWCWRDVVRSCTKKT